jgi:hypothetical protein
MALTTGSDDSDSIVFFDRAAAATESLNAAIPAESVSRSERSAQRRTHPSSS